MIPLGSSSILFPYETAVQAVHVPRWVGRSSGPGGSAVCHITSVHRALKNLRFCLKVQCSTEHTEHRTGARFTRCSGQLRRFCRRSACAARVLRCPARAAQSQRRSPPGKRAAGESHTRSRHHRNATDRHSSASGRRLLLLARLAISRRAT